MPEKKQMMMDKDNPVMLMSEAVKIFHDHMKKECGMLGIPAGWRHILFQLTLQDGVSQSVLVAKTRFRPSTVSVALKEMQQHGYVSLREDSSDMRQTLVFQTEKALELNVRLQNSFREGEETVMKNLESEDRRILCRLLVKMLKNMINEGWCDSIEGF